MTLEAEVEQQKQLLDESQKLRSEVRNSVEALKRDIDALAAESKELASPSESAGAARRAAMEVQVSQLKAAIAAAQRAAEEDKDELLLIETPLNNFKETTVNLAPAVEAAAEKAVAAEAVALRAEQAAEQSEAKLVVMVEAEALREVERELSSKKEQLSELEKEGRQLRVALAEALRDAPTLELGALKEAAESAARRVEALEKLNKMLEERVAKVEAENTRLVRGAVDLQGEEAVMREMLMQHNETFLEKVDAMTEEHRAAVMDRRRLLEGTANLLDAVEAAEARIAARDQVEAESAQLQTTQLSLTSEVQRLRASNDALMQGLEESFDNLRVDPAGLSAEVGKLMRGQGLTNSSLTGSVQADASAVALQIQQVLAEREEAFWVERQKLTDRVAALEKTRGGRTGALLRSYGSAAQADAAPATGFPNSVSEGAASVASSMKGGLAKLRGVF